MAVVAMRMQVRRKRKENIFASLMVRWIGCLKMKDRRMIVGMIGSRKE